MMILPNFVVFEGGDGSGTSTQMDLLRRRFDRRRGPVLHGTAEPTDGPVGTLIRQALGGRLPLRAETLARLFSADRQEHLYGSGGIAEHCARGELVLCDRYVLSSLVYQGITCGHAASGHAASGHAASGEAASAQAAEDLPLLLNRDFPGPELLLFFDLDPDIAARRLETRAEKEIYEYRDFQIRVRQGYRDLLPWYAGQGVRTVSIDASKEPEKVGEDIWAELQKLPILANKDGL
ncbi:thymidylate kinase [Spirochaetia bacterium]|nr:thymidylate kinase [Spirochaetia bacterium]